MQAPGEAIERAAVGSLLGKRRLLAGQRREVDLAALTENIRVRGENLTPGAVAAHAVERRLAVRAAERTARVSDEQKLEATFVDAFGDLSEAGRRRAWASLRTAGWVARLLSTSAPHGTIEDAAAIVAALPRDGSRIDRRRLATSTLGDPHALDQGSLLAGVVLSILSASGRVREKQKPRRAWAEAGVDWDDVTGGLITCGLLPAGWSASPSALITLSPRVLTTCEWPRPEKAGQWVFVTENPSVIGAAAEMSHRCAVRMLCTSGTPSAREVVAVGRLAAAGWRVAVRADFDEAGLQHVGALLAGVPGAFPWRMSAADYEASLGAVNVVEDELDIDRLRAPWAPELLEAMKVRAIPGFEEALLEQLLEDVARGEPPGSPPSQVRVTEGLPTTRTVDGGVATGRWVDAAKTRNWAHDDPVLDWLALYGEEHGFARDQEDTQLIFSRFVAEKTAAFRAAVFELLARRTTVVRVPDGDEAEAETIAALRAGRPVIANAALSDASRKTRSRVDLLIRSDVLASWFPELLSFADAQVGASLLGGAAYHYRQVTVRFALLDLDDSGGIEESPSQRAMAIHASLAADALESVQGYRLSAAYVLGRGWRSGAHSRPHCLDRLARQDLTADLAIDAHAAVSWLRRVEEEGNSWQVLPEPSVPELYPNMKSDGREWSAAKLKLPRSRGQLRYGLSADA